MNEFDRHLVRYIDQYQRRRHYSPTIREMAAACGFSSTSVCEYHLRHMEHEGYLSRDFGVARSIYLLPAANQFLTPGDSNGMVKITLPYSVSVNVLYKPVARGQLVLSEEGRAFKEEAGWLARAVYRDEPMACAVALRMTFFRPRDAGDLSNFLKVAEDALTGVVYVDDKQIVEEHLYRADDPANPRIELELWEAVYAAV